MAASLPNSPTDVDKLTYEIFSILENNFLFGYDNPKYPSKTASSPLSQPTTISDAGKVRILSIDGEGATKGVFAAKALVQLESFLRRKSGNPDARIADYFDIVAGSGVGGVLASLLFTRGKDDGAPMFTAEEAMKLLAGRKSSGFLRRLVKGEKKLSEKIFGDKCTLKDTLKPVLIPCYDLSSNAPFVFSRADALETDGYDFKMRDVCAATSARKPVEVKSVDGRTKIVAVDGRVAMNNPTAAAITHVLNNKQEFPLCNGVEDLLVLSLGNGGSDFGLPSTGSTRTSFSRVAEDGASDMVDQAVSMAFAQSLSKSNYTRIQAVAAAMPREQNNLKQQSSKWKNMTELSSCADLMLDQKYVKSVLFHGKKMTENTNVEMLDYFAGDTIKEQERRKNSILPPVLLKQSPHLPSPRTSSATTLSISSV